MIDSFAPPAAAAPSGIGVQLLDIPAATPNDPRAQIYNSDFIQAVRIHPGAGTIDDGNFVGGNDPAINELITWTAVDQPQLSLLAGEVVDGRKTPDGPSPRTRLSAVDGSRRPTLPQGGPIRARRFVFDSHVCPVIVRFQGTSARSVPCVAWACALDR